MPDRMVTRSDRISATIDKRFGLDATYVVIGEPTEDPVTFVETPTETPITNIKVREQTLSVEDGLTLGQAGLEFVDTSFKVRHAYVPNASAGDEIRLTDTGERYVVMGKPMLDRLKVDWLMFVREVRF